MNLEKNIYKLLRYYGLSDYENVRGHLLMAPVTKVHEGVVGFEIIGIQMSVKILVDESCIWLDFAEELTKYYGVTKEQVIKDALQNTERLAPPVLLKDAQDIISPNSPDGYSMSIVTTKKMRYGAAAMLYKDVLDELSEMYGDVLLVTLSSHEFAAHPLAECNLEAMIGVVKDIQTKPAILDLPEEERLSTMLVYEKRTQKLTRIKY